MNPYKRRRKRRAGARRSSVRRATIRRNPVRRRRFVVSRRRPAHRRVHRRRSSRRTLVVMRNPIRRRSSRRSAVPVARRSGKRRRSGRSGGISSSLTSFKGLMNKENLTIAAGAVGATFGTQWLLTKYGSKLPLVNSTNPTQAKVGAILYAVGLPMIGAYALRKVSPALAKGMGLAALVNGATVAIQQFVPAATPTATTSTTGAHAYLDNLQPMKALPATMPPGYMGASALGRVRTTNGIPTNPLSQFANSGAFSGGAWKS